MRLRGMPGHFEGTTPLQVGGLEARRSSDAGEHAGADVFGVVEGEHHVGPPVAGEHAV